MENLDDDGKLKRRWRNKSVNAEAEGIEFSLTYKQFRKLVARAGLVSSDLGFTGKNYVLARYGDEGGYTYGNCRFITHKENMQERKTSAKVTKSSRRNAKKARAAIEDLGIEEFSRRIKEGQKEYTKERRRKAKKRRKEKEANFHPSYAGKKNSQYGSFWITNGEINKKWHPEKGKLPKGFHRGRAA